MIRSITFKFGAEPASDPLEILAEPVTVFVGPNNSGKSQVLREIESLVRTASPQPTDKIVRSITFEPSSEADLRAELDKIATSPALNEVVQPEHILVSVLNPQSNQGVRVQFHLPSLIMEASNPGHHGQHSLANFRSLFTVRLDGTNRLTMLNSMPAGDLQTTAQNHLAHLFSNDALRLKVRNIVYDAIGKYFVIDPTSIGQLRVRLADRPPSSNQEERGWDRDAVEFHSQAMEVTGASDGIRAFIGIISTIVAGDPKVLLIDEPEAFLHPALAAKLGGAVARTLRQTTKRMFVATHSSSFLMGCIQQGVPLNIVRLTYNFGTPTARVLPQEKILHLMRNPLLRSTGVLAGLFYEAVVVCESDSDRAFYQEINERLLSAADVRGIPNCLFLNAQNKQTVWDIVKPLRELGIPVAAIVDIDFLKDGGQVFTKPLVACNIPELSHQPLHATRQRILTALEATGRSMKRDGGLQILATSDRQSASDFLSLLSNYGLFVVPHGELESWLPTLGASGHGPAWLLEIFQRMGEDPDSPTYLAPTDNDVWDFIGAVTRWISTPNQQGIPRPVP